MHDFFACRIVLVNDDHYVAYDTVSVISVTSWALVKPVIYGVFVFIFLCTTNGE